MKELIKLTKERINKETVETVNARELHSFLESKQDFSTWIKNRIQNYGFQNLIDYVLFHNFMEQKGRGGHNSKEYFLTLDMAKELSMLERNGKGKIARKYFIECEKISHQPKKEPSRKELAFMVIEAENQIELLEEEKKANAPRIEFANTFKASTGDIDMQGLASRLNIKNIGRNNLIKWFKKNGYLTIKGLPKSGEKDLQRLRVDVRLRYNTQGHSTSYNVVMVTPKGQIYFESKIRKELGE